MTLARSHGKRLYPAHLAVALAGRLSTCPLFFTAKRLHSAAHRLLRSSVPWVPLSAHEQNAIAAAIPVAFHVHVTLIVQLERTRYRHVDRSAQMRAVKAMPSPL